MEQGNIILTLSVIVFLITMFTIIKISVNELDA